MKNITVFFSVLILAVSISAGLAAKKDTVATFNNTLLNRTFTAKESTIDYEYSFTAKTLKMIIKSSGHESVNEMDIVRIDDKNRRFIAYPQKKDREKNRAQYKNIKFSYVVFFWERVNDTEVKLIISNKTAPTKAEAEKFVKPQKKDTAPILLKMK